MRSSKQIRQDFFDFFKSKNHTIVPSASLMPSSPNLLFTNAGMNQFVPIFLGEQSPNVDKWAGADPRLPTRAANTQKCIRAGGKHNDLEDVGLDTYHHTFFEMLGNWSFGDYFKEEAIEWAWELVTEVWKFPKERLYATVYQPNENDPAGFDQEAYTVWERIYNAAGLDPKVHIVYGNKKDNFWMMGETGPCGPCSELHVDLTQNGDTKGKLVNTGSSECIEIWNLVFIQLNANPDGSFSSLPASHVDTGMGFERVTSILQCTRNFTNFACSISNYETDIFRPLFDELEKLSGKKYGSTLPREGGGATEQEKIDVAFRVIADHIRTLAFSIADGILPGNTDRNYVLRRILRRAVRFGRTLGIVEPFFYRMADVVITTMGDVFPEVREKCDLIKATIRREESSFNKTLGKGIEHFSNVIESHSTLSKNKEKLLEEIGKIESIYNEIPDRLPISETKLNAIWQILFSVLFVELLPKIAANLDEAMDLLTSISNLTRCVQCLREDRLTEIGSLKQLREMGMLVSQVRKAADRAFSRGNAISGDSAFLLYDTYGFPLDLTELMAKEHGLSVDVVRFNHLMEEQRNRARKAQKKQIIELCEIDTREPTKFVGFENLQARAKVLDVVSLKDKTAVVLDTSPFYAEMGGQVGDTGELSLGANLWRIDETQKAGLTWLHILKEEVSGLEAGMTVTLSVDKARRQAIQRHHSATHIFHWALHEVVGTDVSQKGSYVGPDKMTFDFNSAPLTPRQIANVESLVNERILDNDTITWREVPYSEIRDRRDIMQFFGEKYGDRVRVVQIGGEQDRLNGYSMELCGGTHTRATGQIGYFRIVGESAIAAGIRRVEAVAGFASIGIADEESKLLKEIAGLVNAPRRELEKKITSLLSQQKELEKQIKSLQQRQAAAQAKELIGAAQELNGVRVITQNLGEADGATLQSVADALKGEFSGLVVLGGCNQGSVSLVATVSPELTKRIQAGKVIQAIAPLVGGKGGGRPDNARGGGKDASKLDEALRHVKTLV